MCAHVQRHTMRKKAVRVPGVGGDRKDLHRSLQKELILEFRLLVSRTDREQVLASLTYHTGV